MATEDDSGAWPPSARECRTIKTLVRHVGGAIDAIAGALDTIDRRLGVLERRLARQEGRVDAVCADDRPEG